MALSLLVTISSVVLSQINYQRSNVRQRNQELERLQMATMVVQTGLKELVINDTTMTVHQNSNELSIQVGGEEVVRVCKG